MMLAQLLSPAKGDDDFNQWAYVHYQDHVEIKQAIQKQKNFNVQIQEIDEINWDDVYGWLERHQLMHNDFNGILDLGGNDLTSVDFQNEGQRQTWMWLNFREHQNARAALQI